MVDKKSPKKNLETKRSVALLMGLVAAMSVLYIALEWSQKESKIYTIMTIIEPEEPPVFIPQTKQDLPPVPKPPIAIATKVTTVQPTVPAGFKPVDNTVKVDSGQVTVLTDTTDVYVPWAPTEPEEEVIVEFFQEGSQPLFDGDLNKYLRRNLRYPEMAKINDIKGRVICQFVIDKDGSIIDVKIVRGVDPLLDNEVIRLVKGMPKWKPGTQNGKTVKARYTLPVNFQLSNN